MARDAPPERIDVSAHRVFGTIGIAVSGGNESCDELLRRADVALYTAKREGKDRFAVYSALAA